MVFDNNGKVIYADHEKGPGEVTVRYTQMEVFAAACTNESLQVSGAEAVLAKL